jgi:hypothetical protein
MFQASVYTRISTSGMQENACLHFSCQGNIHNLKLWLKKIFVYIDWRFLNAKEIHIWENTRISRYNITEKPTMKPGLFRGSKDGANN